MLLISAFKFVEIFCQDILTTWNDENTHSDGEKCSRVLSLLQRWNEVFFFITGNAHVLLCQEHPKNKDTPQEGDHPKENDHPQEGDHMTDNPSKGKGIAKHYAIYVVDHCHSEDNGLEALACKLRGIPDNLTMVDIIGDVSSVILEALEQNKSHTPVASASGILQFSHEPSYKLTQASASSYEGKKSMES